MESEVNEGGGDDVVEVGRVAIAVRGGDEVENYVFGVGSMTEDGEEVSNEAAEVGGVQYHGDVDDGGVVVGILV
ncbi:hypothetical protein C1H46_028758 [Malus baccata]|uniref:Uncharacterized protein n=1 Tax=Malus baccata TaxID=106549 RepID=A0A540LGV5_MALBA|nr:hypothetical protein C1H46_028758 [Malus baccata]